MSARWIVLAAAVLLASPAVAQDKKELKWGTDPTGGAPYVYKNDPNGPFIGFEVEFAAYLAGKLGRTSKLVDGDWSTLPELLGKSREGDKGIDIVLNGYELRRDLADKHAVTLPYYVYRLQLVAHKDDDGIDGWGDLAARPGRKAKRVGVLEASVAADYTRKRFGDKVEVLESKDVAVVFEEVKRRGRMDATVQDNPAGVHFTRTMPELKLVDEGKQPSFYVIYLRKDDRELHDQLNAAIKDGIRDGSLKKIYQKYGLWNEDQERLGYWLDRPWPPPADGDDAVKLVTDKADGAGSPWPKLLQDLLKAAWMTIKLAFLSFPLAVAAGLTVAVGRVYGPRWLAFLLAVFVEVVRGTPLLLQLYFLFFMLPKAFPFLALDPFYTGVIGLAINYAAYEAENYRAGLQSVPKGQMEAALAVGMNPVAAIRRVVVPQAVRIVIPPVTNDFIALFKDTSVCSAILITELTRKYNELYNFNRDLVVQLAFLTAALYLLMSYPMSLLARWLERRLGTHAAGGHR